ncbi:MAG: redoxin domain-containing protein [Planctomycetota bacterium]
MILRAATGLFFLLCPSVLAQEEPKDVLEGHSYHGEAFNEGPRQSAYLMGNTGNISFPVTTEDPDVEAFIVQGLGQVHGFWYFEAERSFRQAAALEPDCAMAYWGMALANVNNQKRAYSFAREAFERRESVSPREKLYIEAMARYYGADKEPELDEDGEEKPYEAPKGDDNKKRASRYIEDLETIVWEYPDDIEAKALLVNELWLNTRKGLPISSKQANEALIQQIFDANPMHPTHHYRIHLWDRKETSKWTVESAARIGPSAPGIAHMWHMGGHVFAQLGRHDDAAWQQEASARTDHAFMMRDWVLPDQIHNFAHNNEWLTRSLRSVGRVREAIDLAKNMIELPRHPLYNTLLKRGCSTTYGRQRLLEVLELFEQWDELLALTETMYLEPTRVPEQEARRLWAIARAHHGLGDLDAALAQRPAFERLQAEMKARRVLGKAFGGVELSKRDFDRADRDIEKYLEALTALEELTRGEAEKGLEALEKTRLLGNDHLSRLAFEAGLKEKAEELAKKAIERQDGVAYPHANLAWILHELGQEEEAMKELEAVREISARFDLDMPVFQRLAPLAEAAGHSEDWRVDYVLPDDVGDRTNVADLGPFRWSPITAPNWSLKDGFGQTTSLAAYHGRPVIVIFFLGFGCVHCVEQLNAFNPVADRFQKAGIELVAIGTDSQEQLFVSQKDDSSAEKFAFPIVANPDLEVFKQYRSFDDFEDQPLHGTFLIDEQGRVRWMDVSYEPFMDHQFLLAEAKRLLAVPMPEDAAASGGPE